MASNRHLSRMIVFQSLFEYDFRQSGGESPDKKVILQRNLGRHADNIDDTKFAYKLYDGVLETSDKLDQIIEEFAPDWPIDQIAVVDKVVMRIALYELLHVADDIPEKVAINEAVELAKSFGGDNSSKFVNGVLGSVFKKHVQKSDKTSEESTKDQKGDEDEEA